MSAAGKSVETNKDRLSKVFSASFGMLIGLALLKFPTAAVMEGRIQWPTNIYEVWFASWPVVWAYGALLVIGGIGIFLYQSPVPRPKWLVALPLLWLIWQFIASIDTESRSLTSLTLRHFEATVTVFYLGLLVLPRGKNLKYFWAPVIIALGLVIWIGLREHFFGRAATRQYVYQHEKTHWTDLPEQELRQLLRDQVILPAAEGYTVNPKFLHKVESSRISSTLFYPNSLAGVLLLLGPSAGLVLWQFTCDHLRKGLRSLIVLTFTTAASTCLYYSGSKSGWLIALVLGLIAVGLLPFSGLQKCLCAGGLLALGLSGFLWTHSQFFQKGATSVVARRDYWIAALHITKENPLTGSGPGTFYLAYQKVKKPDAETTRLVHNDYLQQASDSGIPGLVIFGTFIIGAFWRARQIARESPLHFTVVLGLLGWGLQSMVEFNLYMPALAWPSFALLGWLLGSSKESTRTGAQPNFPR